MKRIKCRQGLKLRRPIRFGLPNPTQVFLSCCIYMLVAWFEPSLFPPQFTWMAYLSLTQMKRATCLTPCSTPLSLIQSNAPPTSISSSIFNWLDITEVDVYEVLSSLDPSKAPGRNGISPAVLKYCAVALTPPLHTPFTKSIQSCDLHRQWKLNLSVHMSGDKSDFKNYRPISLLCFISKVLEKLIYN